MIRRTRRAFTLLDLLLTIAILAIISTIAAPSLRPNDSLKLISAATILTADLEFAQSATLEDPADPTILRVDTKEGRYWLAKASDAETPVLRANGTAYEVDFGAGSSQYLDGIGIECKELPDDAVVFDAFGRLTLSDDIVLNLTSPTGVLTVRIAASTGSVYIGK